MQELNDADSPARCLTALEVLGTSLDGRDDTRDLYPAVEAAAERLEDAMRALRKAKNKRTSRTRGLRLADGLEDAAVANVARLVLGHTKGSRDADLYVRLFREAPSVTTSGLATPEQANLASYLIGQLEQPDIPASVKDARAELVAARAGVATAQAARAGTDAIVTAAAAALALAKKEAISTYNGSYPDLLKRFPGQRRLVDLFFYAPPDGRKRSTEPAAEE